MKTTALALAAAACAPAALAWGAAGESAQSAQSAQSVQSAQSAQRSARSGAVHSDLNPSPLVRRTQWRDYTHGEREAPAQRLCMGAGAWAGDAEAAPLQLRNRPWLTLAQATKSSRRSPRSTSSPRSRTRCAISFRPRLAATSPLLRRGLTRSAGDTPARGLCTMSTVSGNVGRRRRPVTPTQRRRHRYWASPCACSDGVCPRGASLCPSRLVLGQSSLSAEGEARTHAGWQTCAATRKTAL